MTESSVSVVLPVYNQAAIIGFVVDEYEAALNQLQNPHELILVVNGSSDGSLAVCRHLAQQHGAVRVIAREQRGWGGAVRLGLRDANGDLLCYTNSARTSARELTLLLQYSLTNPHTVLKANRKVRDNWRRRLGSLVYNLECRALFDLSCWDVNGTPKIFPRKFAKLLGLTRDDDLIDAEFCAICRREGYPMLEVPIFSTRRHGGKSTTNYASALRMYVGAYRLWRAAGQSSGCPHDAAMR